jgi:hypothetical protein
VPDDFKFDREEANAHPQSVHRHRCPALSSVGRCQEGRPRRGNGSGGRPDPCPAVKRDGPRRISRARHVVV